MSAELRGRGLIATSGGADSMALLHHVAELFKARGRLQELLCVTIDHRLRDESADDAAFVSRFAESLGVRCMIQSVEVANRASLEAAARDARYAALEKIRGEQRLQWVATGHTRSDLAETVLMRALRGTGPSGLEAMRLWRGTIVRPLLATSREDTLAYCRNRNIAVLSDPMNGDERFTRVKIRKLMPALRAINPQVEAALCRLSQSSGEERRAIEWAAERLDLTDADDICSAPRALVVKALQLQASQRGIALERCHLLEIVDMMRDGRGSREIHVPGALLYVEYGSVVWPDQVVPRTELKVAGPKAPYLVRSARPGDLMRPLRLKGRHKKLSDLYVDLKIPRRLRKEARVVACSSTGEILWAEHIGLAFGSSVTVTLGCTSDSPGC